MSENRSQGSQGQAPQAKCSKCEESQREILGLKAKVAEMLSREATIKDNIERMYVNPVKAEYEQKLEALKKSLTEGKSTNPYYKVVAVTPAGSFWAIGRKFTKEPTKLYLHEMTADQIVQLEADAKRLPHCINVTKITHAE